MRNAGKTVKSLIAALAAAALTIGMLCSPVLGSKALAAEADAQTCTLTVLPQESQDISDKAVVDIYQVASYSTEEYAFETVKAFADLQKALSDTAALDAKTWAALAQQAAGLALKEGSGIKPVAEGKMKAKISGLEPGLYMIVPRGTDTKADDYDSYVKTNDNKELVSFIAEGGDAFTYLPQLVVLPSTHDEIKPGDVISTADGDWVYDVTVTVKATEESLLSSLKIVKSLLTYESKDPATFVFKVECGDDYSNVVSIVFTKAGKQEVLIEDKFPIGAEVTVTEVYSGANYKATSAASQTVTIAAKEVAVASFTNDYTNTNRGGGSITNQFTYMEDANGNSKIDLVPVYAQ